jgi:hypothetical protein
MYCLYKDIHSSTVTLAPLDTIFYQKYFVKKFLFSKNCLDYEKFYFWKCGQ